MRFFALWLFCLITIFYTPPTHAAIKGFCPTALKLARDSVARPSDGRLRVYTPAARFLKAACGADPNVGPLYFDFALVEDFRYVIECHSGTVFTPEGGNRIRFTLPAYPNEPAVSRVLEGFNLGWYARPFGVFGSTRDYWRLADLFDAQVAQEYLRLDLLRASHEVKTTGVLSERSYQFLKHLLVVVTAKTPERKFFLAGSPLAIQLKESKEGLLADFHFALESREAAANFARQVEPAAERLTQWDTYLGEHGFESTYRGPSGLLYFHFWGEHFRTPEVTDALAGLEALPNVKHLIKIKTVDGERALKPLLEFFLRRGLEVEKITEAR